MKSELQFVNWFWNNVPKGFFNVEKEIPLFDAYKVLEFKTQLDLGRGQEFVHRPIGKIDLKFIFKSTYYLAEVKYQREGNYDFWDSLKIIGYCVYYNWQNNTNYKPAIFVPAKRLHLEHFIVATKLNLVIFSIEEYEDIFIVKRADNCDEYIYKNSNSKKRKK